MVWIQVHSNSIASIEVQFLTRAIEFGTPPRLARRCGFCGAGVSPAVLRSDMSTKIAGGRPALQNPLTMGCATTDLSTHVKIEILELGDCRLLVRGGKLAEAVDHGGDCFECEVNFFVGCLMAQAEAQGGTRIFRSEAERHEDMRRLKGSR